MQEEITGGNRGIECECIQKKGVKIEEGERSFGKTFVHFPSGLHGDD